MITVVRNLIHSWLHQDLSILLAYRDGELPHHKARRLLRRLRHCPPCRENYDALAMLEELMPDPEPVADPFGLLAGRQRLAVAVRTGSDPGQPDLAWLDEVEQYLGNRARREVLSRAQLGIDREHSVAVVAPFAKDMLGVRAGQALADRLSGRR